MTMQNFIFSPKLTEGVIVKRNSQFTITVNKDGEDLRCHCPTTGRVGDIDLAGRPCLLSASRDVNRKTPYTVEAVSLDRPQDTDKRWIGINQTAVNRYVEHFLKNGGLEKIVGKNACVQREKTLGDSKFDFLVNDVYMEVKTPLQSLQVEYPAHVKLKKATPFNSTQRFMKHIAQLGESLSNHQRAVLLVCFVYNNPMFRVVRQSKNSDEVEKTVENSVGKGVEMWQVNFSISPDGVALEKYFPLDIHDIK